MPELPEVETTCRGIAPIITDRQIIKCTIYQPQLRWTITDSLPSKLQKQCIQSVSRRAKYIQIHLANGTLLIHLGMSGYLRIDQTMAPLKKHDHFELCFDNQLSLRLNDSRRFGAVIWSELGQSHQVLDQLGPEPLTDQFNADYLCNALKNRRVAIKKAIMNSHIVVGVGNIYANEALFLSGIHPKTPVHGLSRQQLNRLVAHIKNVLQRAIEQGGTTLKDFRQIDSRPGYFQQKLQVYGKDGQPCPNCQTMLESIRIDQRQTVFCRQCQPYEP